MSYIWLIIIFIEASISVMRLEWLREGRAFLGLGYIVDYIEQEHIKYWERERIDYSLVSGATIKSLFLGNVLANERYGES